MDREQFWALIQAAKTATGGDCQAHAGQLVAVLTERSVGEALAWDRIYGELMAESYCWELWGAAFLINGGCGDDGFDYFRGWPPQTRWLTTPRSAVVGLLRNPAIRWSATTCCTSPTTPTRP